MLKTVKRGMQIAIACLCVGSEMSAQTLGRITRAELQNGCYIDFSIAPTTLSRTHLSQELNPATRCVAGEPFSGSFAIGVVNELTASRKSELLEVGVARDGKVVGVSMFLRANGTGGLRWTDASGSPRGVAIDVTSAGTDSAKLITQLDQELGQSQNAWVTERRSHFAEVLRRWSPNPKLETERFLRGPARANQRDAPGHVITEDPKGVGRAARLE